MGNYQEAIDSIIRHLIITDIPIILLGIILLIIGIVGIKQKWFAKKWFISAIVFVFICFSYVSYRFVSFYMDIHDKNYVQYSGNYKFMSSLGTTGDQVNLLEKDNLRLNSIYDDLGSGTYKGTVIYTERTKFVLHMDGTRIE